MIGDMFDAVLDWTTEGSLLWSLAKFVLVVAVLCSPIVYLVYRLDKAAREDCAKRGGQYVVVGSHLQTTYYMSGKVMMPMTTTVNDYACVGASK